MAKGNIKLEKVPGDVNPADVLTKYVNRQAMEKALATMGMHVLSGRPACAPATMGA